MTPRETGILLAYVTGACPQQKMNDLTPDAWHDILGHLGYEECRQAARAVAARQAFVAPSEIIREIADKRCAEMPHSNACRGGDCRGCQRSWCCCSCHPRAVAAIAGPPAAPARPAVERGGEPVALGDAMRAITRGT
jgi:hypothetical protein